MSKTELLIINNLNYNQIMDDLLKQNDSYKVFPHLASYKTIILIALTTGLPLRELTMLTWNSVLEHDETGEPKCLEYFKLHRSYNFIISNKIQNQILQFYTYLKQPSFDTPIAKKMRGYETFENWHTLTNIALGIRKNNKLGKDDWSKYKNEFLTQILFGRRVIETCGYSKKTSDFLKGLFNIETNQQLLEFLKYKSKLDVKFKLSNISIVEGLDNRFNYGKPKRFLNDKKHFYKKKRKSNEYYPFQHFQTFYNFLKNLRLSLYDLKTQSVLVLLSVSLTNGIRPSSLLKLKWSDLFILGKNGQLNSCILKSSFKFGKHVIMLDQNTMNHIITHFKQLHAGLGAKYDAMENQLTFIVGAPNLDKSCFVTNRMNTLTQPSLKREIGNALRMAGFEHEERLTTKSTMIMYGRRVLELKGNHTPTIRALVKHFNRRSKKDLYKFLYIFFDRDPIRPKDLGEFNSIFEHILYDI